MTTSVLHKLEPEIKYFGTSSATKLLKLEPDIKYLKTSLTPTLSLNFRMRGFDTNLNKLVFWDSDGVDGAGADYTSPGDLQGGSIRVWKVVVKEV